MNERRSRLDRCAICLEQSSVDERRNACERYLLAFLLDLQTKLDDQKEIEEHFSRSIFNNEQTIDRVSCTGLTLMHVNLLGGREDSGEEDENQQFVPQYDELVAVQICQILLNNGASPHGNVIYEMRPIHIATRRQWMQVVRVLLEAGVNPNLPEKDLYASRPIDIAVLNDDPPMIQLLHRHGASLHGHKSMFHLIPLAEAFTRGYFETFQILLELGARPCLDLERNTFRSFGTDLFLTGAKGRQHFIQLLFEHGGNIETELKIHAIRIEPDGIIRRQAEVQFSCDPICIADMDASIFSKWICESRSLKALCRLTLRRYYFQRYTDGFRRLRALRSHELLNQHLYEYLMFNLRESFLV